MKRKMVLHKGKDDSVWFIGIYSNNFIDREDEIFSKASHAEYIAWFKDAGVRLPITVLHLPKLPFYAHITQHVGLASGSITPDEYSDNYSKLYKPMAFAEALAITPLTESFNVVIGKVLEGKEDVARKVSESDWGMSHGYLCLEKSDNVIDKYRTFEFTVLPKDMAANSITTFDIKEFGTMDAFKNLSEQDQETLAGLLESVREEEMSDATTALKDMLTKFLDSKQLDDGEEDVEVVDEGVEYDEIRQKLWGDFNMEGVQKAFQDVGTVLDTLSAKIDSLSEKTEKTEDEIIAHQFFAPMYEFKSVTEDDADGDVDLEKLKENSVNDKGIPTTKDGSDNALVRGFIEPMFGNK